MWSKCKKCGCFMSKVQGAFVCKKCNPAGNYQYAPIKKDTSTENVTDYIILIDASDSMERFIDKIPLVVKDWIKTIIDANIKHKTNGFLEVKSFAGMDCERTLIHRKGIFTQYNSNIPYVTHGYTALYDALYNVMLNNDINTPTVVLTLTDGEENNSKTNLITIRNMISKYTQGSKWTFSFMVPNEFFRRNLLQSLPIFEGNVIIWQTTEKGLDTVKVETQCALDNYTEMRSIGKTSTSAFYVQTDLSSVKVKDLARMNDVTTKVKIFNVEKEQDIKFFVEQKTRSPYVVGSAYYQLMKSEKIAPDKSVLLWDKRDKIMYAGEETRVRLGLPSNVTAKVDIGNHMYFDIFVQSKSLNRILPRGTKVAILK